MRYECPACQRTFDQAGFCPYDGKPLAGADHPTLSSGNVPAQRAPSQERTKVHAVSASDGTSDAKAALRDQPGEYDRLVGESLDGRYVVQRKLGEGGMGVVFAAKHAIIERPLAIKVLKREATREPSTVRRLVQEAKAASRIGHPNIVDVTDFGTTPDGLTYSVMELVDGPTLKQVIRAAAPFPPARAVHIVAQLARALAAAHDKGIVHRDLKPENVFLIDRDGRPDFVKIVDFGIAKVQPIDGANVGPKLTRVGAVVGTPEYMAPEQASGRGDADHRVDIYALGTMLYEMLVGRVPHKDRSMVRTIAMQMLDPIIPPSQVRPDLMIPPELEAIVMKALAKDREQRYASMAQLYASLDHVRPLVEGLSSAPTVVDPLELGTSDALGAGALKPQPSGAPRRAKPATKQLHEPEFVAGPLTLQAPLDDEPAPAFKPARWPWVLAALAVVSVGAAIVIVTMHARGGDAVAVVGDASTSVTRDAAVIARASEDAAVVELPMDAPVAHSRDAGMRHRDSHDELAVNNATANSATVNSVAMTGVHPDKVTIEVLTRPAETNVFVGTTFRGPSGVRLTEAYGARLTIECRAPHFKGTKQIVFDGKITSVLCTATRLPFCVKELHNPIDPDCEPVPESDGGSGATGPVIKPSP